MKSQIWFPLIGVTFGFSAVYFSQYTLSPMFAPYLSIAVLAALDAICGGIRAALEGKFTDGIFITGFIINTVLAALLAWIGDKIGVDIVLAAVVMIGGRIFLNLSLIRRLLLTKATS